MLFDDSISSISKLIEEEYRLESIQRLAFSANYFDEIRPNLYGDSDLSFYFIATHSIQTLIWNVK